MKSGRVPTTGHLNGMGGSVIVKPETSTVDGLLLRAVVRRRDNIVVVEAAIVSLLYLMILMRQRMRAREQICVRGCALIFNNVVVDWRFCIALSL